ncbi:proline-rich protein 7-like, partial [Marmota monax]|uniref:proline-rich protein 7-like n=1 Tax=Marmota monax TaxID=9995 RepID=UPI001EB0A42F
GKGERPPVWRGCAAAGRPPGLAPDAPTEWLPQLEGPRHQHQHPGTPRDLPPPEVRPSEDSSKTEWLPGQRPAETPTEPNRWPGFYLTRASCWSEKCNLPWPPPPGPLRQEDTRRHPDTSGPLRPTRIPPQGLLLGHVPRPALLCSLSHPLGQRCFPISSSSIHVSHGSWNKLGAPWGSAVVFLGRLLATVGEWVVVSQWGRCKGAVTGSPPEVPKGNT